MHLVQMMRLLVMIYGLYYKKSLLHPLDIHCIVYKSKNIEF